MFQGKHAEKNGGSQNDGSFKVPRNIDLSLDRAPVVVGDLVQLRLNIFH